MEKEQCERLISRPRNEAERKLLRKIGQNIRKDLHNSNKSIEWLSWESEVARSTVQRVFRAEGNTGVLTLDRLVKGLGYRDIIEFLNTI